MDPESFQMIYFLLKILEKIKYICRKEIESIFPTYVYIHFSKFLIKNISHKSSSDLYQKYRVSLLDLNFYY